MNKEVAVELSNAEKVILFIEEYLRVPEGKMVGQKVVLRDWQKEIIRRIYDAEPRPRQAIISFGRKNGKTALIAMLMLAHVVGPMTKRNSQVYSCAQTRDQAAVVFSLAAKMVRMDATLTALTKIQDSYKQIVGVQSGTVYKALSSDATSAYGLSPVLVIYDELGQVRGPTSPMYEAMESAMGAQEDPLSIVISTQAATDQDLMSILIDDALESQDPKIVLALHTTEKSDDIQDPKVWAKANPALGDFRSYEDVEAQAEKAARMPVRENMFRNLILNQRVSALNLMLSLDLWKANGAPPDPAILESGIIYGGLDLSSRQDLTAFVALVEDGEGNQHVFPRFWTPADTLHDRSQRDRTPYDHWVDIGVMRATPGSSIDYDVVVRDMAEEFGHLSIGRIAFDRWKMDEFRRSLGRIGWEPPLVEHGQGYRDMSPSIDVVEHLALASRLRHGMHPVLTYCIANTVVEVDPAGNRKVNKARSAGRIDGSVALIMAARAAEIDATPVDVMAMIG